MTLNLDLPVSETQEGTDINWMECSQHTLYLLYNIDWLCRTSPPYQITFDLLQLKARLTGTCIVYCVIASLA